MLLQPILYTNQEGLIRIGTDKGKSALDPHFVTKRNGEWQYNQQVLKQLAKSYKKNPKEFIEIYETFLSFNQEKSTEELITAFEKAMK